MPRAKKPHRAHGSRHPPYTDHRYGLRQTRKREEYAAQYKLATFPLLKLPRELRDQIYKHVVLSEGALDPFNSLRQKWPPVRLARLSLATVSFVDHQQQPAITRVSQQLVSYVLRTLNTTRVLFRYL
jgi:hypothetical protein